MSVELLDRFTTAVGATATIHTCSAAEFTETVTAVVTEPAIGTPLSLAGVSFEGTPVETEYSPSVLEQAETGVTPATYAIAEYGTLTVPTDAEGSELVSLYTSQHVAVLAASQLVPDMETAYERFGAGFAEGSETDDEQPRTQIFATGPSATADMGTLVQGVHGPHEVHIILVEDR